MQAAAIVMVAGTLFSAYGQYKAGQAQQGAYEYNAANVKRQTVEAEADSRENLRKHLATMRTQYAKAGVDITSGSPLMALAFSAAAGEKEALRIRAGGAIEEEQLRYSGKQASTAGKIGAFSTLLTGLGQAGGTYYAAKG